jgi:hypothetical protein
LEEQEGVMNRRYFVRRDGRVPQDVVELIEHNDQEVAFFPAGGGFQYRMPTARFDATHHEVSPAEFGASPAYAGTFDIDGMFGGLPGYSFGQRWNGWACPYFPRESCDRMVAVFGDGARHDEETDAYLIPDDDGSGSHTGFQTCPAQHITVGGKHIKVWAVGNGSWTWEEKSGAE